MTNNENTITAFYSLRSLSSKLFGLISKQLNVSTAYVTKRGEHEMTVLSSFNKEEEIIPEGYSVKYGGTYCRLIIMNDGDVMRTNNLMIDDVTRQLDVTGELNVKGFMGVTLRDLKGNIFGTLCVMDREEKNFSDEDVHYLKSIAEILSYVIELDQTKFSMGFLSVPIIPITEGISILSVQGIVDKERADQILSDVLHNAADHDIDYFIIDLSKLHVQDHTFSGFFFDMISALNLMGVETIITGVTPTFAREQVDHFDFKGLSTKIVKDIQSALDHIGYTLIEK